MGWASEPSKTWKGKLWSPLPKIMAFNVDSEGFGGNIY